MKNSSPFFAALLVFLFVAASSLLALDPPIVLDPPVIMDVLSKEGAKSDVRYLGQPAKDGKIDLTATNGFFDRCFEAFDYQKIIPGDERLIGCSFGYLGRLSDAVPGTARWHLWCAQTGEIKATFFMQVPADEANHLWVIKTGDETQSLKVIASDGQSPQPQTLTFSVKQPGKLTFAIDCTKNPPSTQTRIYYIHLEGSAVNKASLLRVRWRPAAVHAHFYAPASCPAPKMWVFETMDMGKTGSYSPLTTPFGYFGTSFNNGGVIPAGAGFNFSMWIAGRTATQAPPIEKMPRLIGTDIPDAQYSTFGGEGTGVKFRAAAYKKETDRTIQALRIEAADDLVTYYGYFYDEQEKHWKLYASAQALVGRKNGKNGPNFGTMGGTGSFCEIPGPPNRERSGDLVREIKRRGWFYGSDQKWYRSQLNADVRVDPPTMDVDDADETPAPKTRAKHKPPAATQEAPPIASSIRVYYMSDYAADGWMAMATGGMESYSVSAGQAIPVPNDVAPAALPEYLSPEKTAQLFDLPVQFGESNASEIAADHATIGYEIKKTGPNSKAVLYYGTVDSLTYPAQKVTKGSAVEIDMYRPQRTWQFATPEQEAKAGVNQFKLGGLKADTTYYYRLFVAHDQGKSWDYRSGKFTTGK